MISIYNPNNTEEIIFQNLGRIGPLEELSISDEMIYQWAKNTNVITAIVNGTVVLRLNGNDITDIAIATKLLMNTAPVEATIISTQPFASKILSNGAKLFRRKKGYSLSINANSNNSIYIPAPYSLQKINKVELICGACGDQVDLAVYDSEDGVYQLSLGVAPENINPDLELNKFSDKTYVIENVDIDESNYDAELPQNYRIKITYYNNSPTSDITVYFNIVWHQVVS